MLILWKLFQQEKIYNVLKLFPNKNVIYLQETLYFLDIFIHAVVMLHIHFHRQKPSTLHGKLPHFQPKQQNKHI